MDMTSSRKRPRTVDSSDDEDAEARRKLAPATPSVESDTSNDSSDSQLSSASHFTQESSATSDSTATSTATKETLVNAENPPCHLQKPSRHACCSCP
ncbi:hypothetical protein MTO96_027909 [Rhipicephalus appendiculatus]